MKRFYCFKLNFLALLLIQEFGLNIVRSQGCQKCVDLSAFSCVICYNTCPSTNQTLTKCSWTYCSSENSTGQDQLACQHYDTINLPETNCFSKCCSSQQKYFNLDELNRCVKKNSIQGVTSIIIESIIGGILFFIIVLFCVCTKICRDLRTNLRKMFYYICSCQCFRKSKQLPPKLNLKEPHSQMNISWEQQGKSKERLNDHDENCAICLENKPNIMTGCGHFYHLDCIQAWHARNQHCPLCLSPNISQIKIFCKGCQQMCTKFNFKKQNTSAISNKIKCPHCQASQIVK